MVPRRDDKQWDDACREVGLGEDEIKKATRDFHTEKRLSGDRRHWPYGNLIIWLREWREDQWQS
jgi:hypothetical protein